MYYRHVPLADITVLYAEVVPYAMSHEEIMAKFEELRVRYMQGKPPLPANPYPTRYERPDPV